MTTPVKEFEQRPSHKMPKTHVETMSTIFIAVLLFLQSQMITFCNGASVLDLNPLKAGDFGVMVKRVCAGKVRDCPEVAMEEEMMDSEDNRRVLLMQRRYISYDTLKRDLVPCTKPGASYYNCKGATPANSYNRGCEVITRCAREISGTNP